MLARLFPCALISTGLACADGVPAITEAANRLERQSAKAPAAVRVELRVMAAKALQHCDLDLAHRFAKLALDELRAGKDWKVGSRVIEGLAVVAPDDAISVLPVLPTGSSWELMAALLQSHHTDAALSVYRQGLQRADLQLGAASGLLEHLAKENPSEEIKLFHEIISAFPVDITEPSDAWGLVHCANAVSAASPAVAADAYERIVIAAAKPGFAEGKEIIRAKFRLGSQELETKNTRDTLLVAAGSHLRKVAPEKFEKFSALFSQWNLSAPAAENSVSFSMPSGASAATPDPVIDAVLRRLGELSSKPNDPAGAKAAIDLAADVQRLPPGAKKLLVARELFNLYTKGGVSHRAVPAVAATLGHAIHETPASADDYLALGTLVHYEHAAPPFPDAALDSAVALFALQDQIYQKGDFSLMGIDGKTYSLTALRGHIVLFNFWATWCGPCRAEMPDMDKLYRDFEKKGLVVLAVSDEERDTVEKFMGEKKYTFPVLLDPGRKVHTTFDVQAIPRSFVFDREGQLVTQALDARTEEQFLQMLKQAGLE